MGKLTDGEAKILQALDRLTAAVDRLTELMSRPTEVTRDDKGKVIGGQRKPLSAAERESKLRDKIELGQRKLALLDDQMARVKAIHDNRG